MAPPTRRIRSAPRSRSRCCGSTTKAACWPTGSACAPYFAAGLDALRAHPLVGDARHRGLLGALELVSDKASKRGFDAALGLPDRIFAAAYRNGVVFRCFGDGILGFAPALTFTEDEFEQMFARLKKTLDEVLAAPDVRAALAA